MTGPEFKLLRKFSGVSQGQVAEALGLKTHCSISLLEKQKLVPLHKERLLIKLCKLEDLGAQGVKQYIEEIMESKEKEDGPFSLEKIFFGPSWQRTRSEFISLCQTKFDIYSSSQIQDIIDVGIKLAYLKYYQSHDVLELIPQYYRYYKSAI